MTKDRNKLDRIRSIITINSPLADGDAFWNAYQQGGYGPNKRFLGREEIPPILYDLRSGSEVMPVIQSARGRAPVEHLITISTATDSIVRPEKATVPYVTQPSEQWVVKTRSLEGIHAHNQVLMNDELIDMVVAFFLGIETRTQ